MEFRVCFTVPKYENDMFSLCETSYAFIDAFCYSKIHFHQSISLHVLLGLSPVWNRYPKGSLAKGANKRSLIVYDEIKDKICNE